MNTIGSLKINPMEIIPTLFKITPISDPSFQGTKDTPISDPSFQGTKDTPISDPPFQGTKYTPISHLSGTNGLTSTPTASSGNFFALNRLSYVKGTKKKNETYGDSSLRTARLTAVAVGKPIKTNYSDGAASTEQGKPVGNHTTTRNALNRVRNGSCVAPKKKTAIANTFQSGGSSTMTGSGNRQLF
jgi:hypothetical protein